MILNSESKINKDHITHLKPLTDGKSLRPCILEQHTLQPYALPTRNSAYLSLSYSVSTHNRGTTVNRLEGEYRNTIHLNVS